MACISLLGNSLLLAFFFRLWDGVADDMFSLSAGLQKTQTGVPSASLLSLDSFIGCFQDCLCFVFYILFVVSCSVSFPTI